MEQLSFNLENVVEDIYLEFEDTKQEEIISYNLKKDLLCSRIDYITTKEKLKQWFLNKFFDFDIEISCEDLYNIAMSNNIKLI